MLAESLQDQAAVHAAGAMPAVERDSFELALDFDPELRALVAELEEASALTMLATSPCAVSQPSAELKSRIFNLLDDRAQQTVGDGLVMTDCEGLVQWINEPFTALCGYTLEEVRGRKLGPLLQGPQTDPAAAQRMREAVHAFQPCLETILNYHKDGTPYWVEISLAPLLDSDGKPRALVARERQVAA